jgi:hypothetical protein
VPSHFHTLKIVAWVMDTEEEDEGGCEGGGGKEE